MPDTSGGDSVWSPKGINAANLAAMVADPADLVRGRSDKAPVRTLATRPVIDLLANPSGASSGGAGGGWGVRGAGVRGRGGGAAAGPAPRRGGGS